MNQHNRRLEQIKICIEGGDNRTAAELLLPAAMEYRGKKFPKELELVFAAVVAHDFMTSKIGSPPS